MASRESSVTTPGSRRRATPAPTTVALLARSAPMEPDPARVALVRPAMLVPRVAITAPTCPPVGLAYLASALRREGHDLVAIDAVGEAPDQFLDGPDDRFLVHGLSPDEVAARLSDQVEVIGVSCMFSHEWPLNRALIEVLRARCPDALIVVGGEHPTALGAFVLDDCPAVDVVVAGEGELALAQVIARRRDPQALAQVAGVTVRASVAASASGPGSSVPSTRIGDVDALAPPAWDLFPMDAYLDRGHGFGVHRGRSMPVVATRGCPYQCTFCSSPAMWTPRWVPREPSDVLDEIEGYLRDFNADNIDFYDLTAIVRRSWIIEFCELIIDRDLHFTWQLPSGTRSEVIDETVVALLARTGCRNMSYAPESGSPRVLARIKKRVDLGRMKRSMRSAVRAGINCKANIILGLPGETHGDVFKTLKFCASVAWLGLHDLSITPYSPYPGTELYDELRSEGRIGELDDAYFLSLASYSDLTSTVSWSTHISNAALGRYRLGGMSMFYSVSYLRRPWRVPTLVRNVLWSDTQESRLEMSLRDSVHRRRQRADNDAMVGQA